MKAFAAIFVTLFSFSTHATTTDDSGCRIAQAERIDQISSLKMSNQERYDVYMQCRNSDNYYWFSTELYLTAREFGDTHEAALGEYYLYSGVGYTVSQYKKMREMTRGSNLQITEKREILKRL